MIKLKFSPYPKALNILKTSLRERVQVNVKNDSVSGKSTNMLISTCFRYPVVSVFDRDQATDFPGYIFQFVSFSRNKCALWTYLENWWCRSTLVWNLNSPKLCNGLRLRVKRLKKYVVGAETVIGRAEVWHGWCWKDTADDNNEWLSRPNTNLSDVPIQALFHRWLLTLRVTGEARSVSLVNKFFVVFNSWSDKGFLYSAKERTIRFTKKYCGLNRTLYFESFFFLSEILSDAWTRLCDYHNFFIGSRCAINTTTICRYMCRRFGAFVLFFSNKIFLKNNRTTR